MADIEFQIGWPGDGRHRSLIDESVRLLSLSGMNPDLLYIVPTSETVAEVQGHILEQLGSGTICGTVVLTFNSLVRTILSRLPNQNQREIDDSEKQLIIEQILTDYSKSSRAEPGSLAATWIDSKSRSFVLRLAQTISELKLNLCRDGKSLLDDIHQKSVPSHLDRDVAAIYDRYRAYLDKKHLVDSEGTFYLVYEALKEDFGLFRSVFPDVSHLFVEGFRDFTEVETRILRLIVGAVDRVILSLDYAPRAAGLFAATKSTYDLYSEFAPPTRFGTETDESQPSCRRSIQAIFEWCAADTPTDLAKPVENIELIEYTDPRSEILHTADDVKTLLAENGYATRPERIAVIVPKNDFWPDITQETFLLSGIPVTCDARRPLAQSAAVGAIMAVLRTRLSSFDRADVLALLSNPYVGGRPDISIIERHSTSLHITGGSAESWLKPFAARVEALKSKTDKKMKEGLALETAVDRLARLFETVSAIPLESRPRDIADKIIELINKQPVAVATSVFAANLADDRPELAAAESESIKLFTNLLRKLCAAFERCGYDRVTLERVVETLTVALTETTVRPARNRTAGVVITTWGTYSARQYDYVFIVGLTENNLPERAPYRIFFREDVRRSCTFFRPPASGVDRGWLDLVAASLSARVRLRLSWSKTAWNDTLTTPSLYIDEIRDASGLEPETPNASTVLSRTETGLQRMIGAALRPRDNEIPGIETAREIIGELRRRNYGPLNTMVRGVLTTYAREMYGTDPVSAPYQGGIRDKSLKTVLRKRFGRGNHVFSVSQLNTYASCPFRFFFERVLELNRPDEFREDVMPKDKGVLVHEILRRFFARWKAETGKSGILVKEMDRAKKMLWDVATTVLKTAEAASYGTVFWDALQTDLCRGLDTESDRPGLLEAVLKIEIGADPQPIDRYLEWRFGRPASESGTSDSRSVDSELYISGADRDPDIDGIDDVMPIRIAGKIDRIDVFDGGIYTILDYKTSTKIPSKKSVAAGEDYQLGVYALAVNKFLAKTCNTLAGMGYYTLSSAETVESKLFGEKPEEAEGIMNTVATNIINDVAAICDGRFEANADDDKFCSYCDCRYVCRSR